MRSRTWRHAVLIFPFPVETSGDSGAGDQVSENLSSYQSSLASHTSLSFSSRAAEILADTGHLAVNFETGYGKVMRLARSVLSGLLQA